MKHKNKTLEEFNKIRATRNLQSCFNYWLNKPNQYWPEIQKRRESKKTIIVRFEDL